MTTLMIALVGIAALVTAAWLSIRGNGAVPVVDPSRETNRMVRWLSRHPRLAAFVARRLDASTAGGLLLTLSVAAIFFLSLFAGWVFDSLDENSGFAQLDEAVAEWGAENATDTSTFVLNLLTDMGGTLVIALITAAVAIYGWVRYRNFHVALFIVAVSLSQTVVNNGLKWIIDRERPNVSQLAGWAGSSFPSGHSAAAAATYAGVAFVLALAASPRVRALLFAAAIALAAAIAATRALLGVHWLTDVLAGLAVGWSCFIAVAVAFGGRLMRLGEPIAEQSRAAVVETATR